MTSQVVDLEFRPRPWQATCFKSLLRFSVLIVHRRGGKTLLAILLLLSRALSATLPHSRYSYIAPEKGQAKRVAWEYLKRFATKVPGTRVSEVELWVEFANGARIQIDGADDPDRLRGIYLDGAVLDELADMRPQTWGEVVRPALTDRCGWALFIGTPKGLNLLSELFYSAAGKPDWFSARYTIQDTQAIAAEEVESARRDMSRNQFAQEFMCDFAAGNDDAFMDAQTIDRSAATDAFALPSDPLILGVDVARFGADETVIWFRRGRDARTIPPVFMRGADTMTVAGRVTEELVRWGGDQVFVDETGVGGGVIDRLRQLGVSCVGVNNGAKSDRTLDGELVANKGAEMWATMRQWIKTGGAIPSDTELRMQLGSRRYGHNAHNEIVLEKKSDMKKRGISSPDRADALALTFSYPVAPKHEGLTNELRTMVSGRNGGNQSLSEYDPLASIR